MADITLAKIVGSNIANHRRKQGLTQAQLAENLNIGQDALSRMEKGIISPKMGRLQEIAQELDCSVADLFRTGNESTNDRAVIIATMLEPLTPDQQEAVINLVAIASQGMKLTSP